MQWRKQIFQAPRKLNLCDTAGLALLPTALACQYKYPRKDESCD